MTRRRQTKHYVRSICQTFRLRIAGGLRGRGIARSVQRGTAVAQTLRVTVEPQAIAPTGVGATARQFRRDDGDGAGETNVHGQFNLCRAVGDAGLRIVGGSEGGDTLGFVAPPEIVQGYGVIGPVNRHIQ